PELGRRARPQIDGHHAPPGQEVRVDPHGDVAPQRLGRERGAGGAEERRLAPVAPVEQADQQGDRPDAHHQGDDEDADVSQRLPPGPPPLSSSRAPRSPTPAPGPGAAGRPGSAPRRAGSGAADGRPRPLAPSPAGRRTRAPGPRSLWPGTSPGTRSWLSIPP